MSTSRGGMTYIRDLVLFGLGVAIILKQAGIVFPPPASGPSLELLFLGALFCNGPLFLSYLSIRRGTSMPLPEVPPSVTGSPSVRPDDSSGGGE